MKMILLVKHKLGPRDELWIPPGGEIQAGESASDSLKREYREETGLHISVENLLFVYEFINDPFHAVELFFEVSREGGALETGNDPELTEQIILSVEWKDFTAISDMDLELLHGIFKHVDDPSQLLSLRGFITPG